MASFLVVKGEREGVVVLPPSIARWGVAGALLAGIGWMVSGFFYVFPGEGDGPEGSLSWYLIESADAIAEVGMLAALVGLHVRQAAEQPSRVS